MDYWREVEINGERILCLVTDADGVELVLTPDDIKFLLGLDQYFHNLPQETP